MTASGDLLFPFVISCLLFIRGYCPLPAGLGDTGVEIRGPLQPDGISTKAVMHRLGDYDYEEHTPSVPTGLTTQRGTFEKCKYDACLENQTPCGKLAASTGCLCPGLTLPNKVPEKPTLRSVSWNGSDVAVSWCAPDSYVTAYVVTVGGQERQRFGADKRSGAAGEIDDIEEVCVVAVNNAGKSSGSCMMYKPWGRSLPLTAGLIGGALGLLVLVLLAVMLWRHKRQRKQEGITSTDN